MNTSCRLRLSTTGRVDEAIRHLATLAEFSAQPTSGWLDSSDEIPMADLSRWATGLTSSSTHPVAFWGRDDDEAMIRRKIAFDGLHIGVPRALGSDVDAMHWLETMPYDVATIGDIDLEADTPSKWFPGHFELGWGVAFRGKGHDIMMSRRWIERGPWTVIKRPGDLTILQVHSLTDTRSEMESRIRRASRALYWRTGGEITRTPVPVRGLYTAETRTFEIVVAPDIVVDVEQMNSARALIGKGSEPIDRVAFVFIDRADAERQLHALWLRDLECWFVDDAGRHRLDDRYTPASDKEPDM